MPRIRHDNDARYALRASFVDENGNVLRGDTIVITSAAGTVDSRITDTDISNWNTAYSWGDHGTAGYLVATTTDKANWNTAYGWGDHAGLYLPLSGGTVTGDVSFLGKVGIGKTASYKLDMSSGAVPEVARFQSTTSAADILLQDNGTATGNVKIRGQSNTLQFFTDGTLRATIDATGTATFSGTVNAGSLSVGNNVTLDASPRSGVVAFENTAADTWTGWESDTGGLRWAYLHRDSDGGVYDETNGQWKIRYNATQGTDLYYANGIKLSTTATGVSVTGVVSADGGSSTNWNTAFGWGNHASAGYLTAIPSTYVQNNVNADISAHWEWQDAWQIRFGNSADSRMWWDGTANRFYHRNYTHGSDMLWQAENAGGTNVNMLYLDPDSGAYLYSGGSTRLQTISAGVDITGNCNANNGQLFTNQQLRATGWWGTNGSTSWGGPAAEVGYSGGRAYLLGYSRDAQAYSPVTVGGLGVTLDGNGSGVTINNGTLTLNTVNDAPAAWLPILIQDGGEIKQDSACRVHGNGYIQANYFNTNHGQTTRNSDTIFYSSTDDYIRKNTAAGMRSSLSVYSKAEVDALPSGVTNITDNVTGNYGSVQTVATAGTSGGWHGYNAGGYGVFMMASNATGGIYDDVNNRWMFYSADGSETAMYYAGSKKGYTYSSGYRVTGNLLATSDVYAYYSDERLKTKTGVIENPLAKINAIETFYYKHGEKALELGYEGEEQQVGVSAQSVQAVLPEVVGRAPIDDDGEGGSVSGEDYITVKYDRIVPLLIEGIKELTAELESVKLELQELKANG